MSTLTSTLRPMRFDGERRQALAFEIGAPPQPPRSVVGLRPTLVELGQGQLADLDEVAAKIEMSKRDAALVYGLVAEEIADTVFARLGWTSLGAVPELVRP